jgi:hypothetical protein
MNVLMTRDYFRRSVFERDNYQCVICGGKAVDAHHIIERRLFDDGGYYLDNGASVCKSCHLQCEKTKITVEDCRDYAGITSIVLPRHLDKDCRYDKWGNPYVGDKRAPGELFFDESVQKVLKWCLSDFVAYVKYPKTPHFPWSTVQKEADIISGISFEGREVVVTEKMDGENITMYNDKIHARSIDSEHKEHQSWVKQFHAQRAHDIPPFFRVCGENLYRQHGVHYDRLPSFFLGFSVWDFHTCLSWNDTEEWFSLLGIQSVPVLYKGMYNEAAVRAYGSMTEEGYVVRTAGEFNYKDFRFNVAKYVKPSFSNQHWIKDVKYNKLDVKYKEMQV